MNRLHTRRIRIIISSYTNMRGSDVCRHPQKSQPYVFHGESSVGTHLLFTSPKTGGTVSERRRRRRRRRGRRRSSLVKSSRQCCSGHYGEGGLHRGDSVRVHLIAPTTSLRLRTMKRPCRRTMYKVTSKLRM